MKSRTARRLLLGAGAAVIGVAWFAGGPVPRVPAVEPTAVSVVGGFDPAPALELQDVGDEGQDRVEIASHEAASPPRGIRSLEAAQALVSRMRDRLDRGELDVVGTFSRAEIDRLDQQTRLEAEAHLRRALESGAVERTLRQIDQDLASRP